MAKLGEVSLFIEKESEKYRVEATEYAVEKGEPFTDHVAKRPEEFTITGYILSDNWQLSRDKLKGYMNSGTILKYVGKTTASDVVILDMPLEHDSNIKNGAAINITLRKIRITKTAWEKADSKQKPQQKPTTNSGKKKPVSKNSKPANAPVYHIMKKGQTYWWLAKKYGTTVGALRELNPWPDRQIPIGAKARVK